LRKGRWDDASAPVVPFPLGDLLGVVESFGGQPIYGWEFFDLHKNGLGQWTDRLSLDWRSGNNGLSRSISLFQASATAPERHLDFCVWFDDLEVRTRGGEPIPLEEFAAGGRRWWDALYAGDQRTAGHGIVPAGPAG